MRPALSVSLLLLSVTVQQACQRDEPTAPRGLQPTLQVQGASASRIAFTRGFGDIYVMNADGSAPVQLTNSPSFDGQASWSPDGRQIAFVSERDAIGVENPYNIYVMNADGSAQTRLTFCNSDACTLSDPSWSPDGRQIAFAQFPGFIYVMNADGSSPTQLTYGATLERDPSWSPDGRQIAFTGVDGDLEIYVMNADGSAPRQLTNNSFRDIAASWSPDGSKIVFQSERDGNAEIYVMNADGSSQTRLTNNPGSDGSPTWSPDGRQIAFASNRDGNLEIYVMNADGSSQTRLTNDPDADYEPAWSPAQVPSRSRAPAQLAFTTQPPATVSVNAAISPAVQVTATDASGAPVPGGAVRLAVGTSPSAGATLSGTTVARIVNGVATFTDVRIDQVGQGYTLVAEAGRVSATSAAFAVVEPGMQFASPRR
jgi:tricorn protease-like protein